MSVQLEKDLTHYLLNTSSKNAWRRIGTERRAGILVGLFSVYSKRSAGCGDLEDIRLLIDWCKRTGNSILQLLPMNEVGILFCPYDAMSSFALEPMYIALDRIDAPNKKIIQAKIENFQREFPLKGECFDYRIKKEKVNFLWELFNRMNFVLPKGMLRFIDDNEYWINDFALFKALKDYHQGRAWYEWEEKYRNRDRLALKAFSKEHEREIRFQMWLQWQLYKQFTEVKSYAKAKNIFIKGDLPILVSHDSADVWQHPEFFKLEFAAGAPPDMYCAKGQRWGMPTHNWRAIEDDGFVYIKERLRYAGNFYDIVRIDHVVGLFRIWSIPVGEPLENKGLNGFFEPKDEKVWEGHGRRILSVMAAHTKMLLCAEDLGIIPSSCPKALKEFGIPGNDVQRWVKDWKVKHNFLKPEAYRELSVAVLSTQDTTNWPAWWENEAGTVDEQLFIRKCQERAIDYRGVREKLFDSGRSCHGRLRWRETVSSVDALVNILGKPKLQLADFIEMYENSYLEKEKLWKLLEMPHRMQEKATTKLIRKVLQFVFDSAAIFSIQVITDILSLAGFFKEDYYKYRINFPGTISPNNWSLLVPISLDELLKHPITQKLRTLITCANRYENNK